jgi:Tol biopolymer transport system component
MTPQQEDHRGPSHEPTPEIIRLQLERIARSPIFSKSARLTAFLRYVVAQTLASQADSLKEPVIAMELYGRGSDFDSALDPVVRVDARRLRDKLREYYAESSTEPVIISLPKGSYVPVFEWGKAAPVVVELPPPPQPAASEGRRGVSRKRPIIWAAVGVALAMSAGLLYFLRSDRPEAPVLRPLGALPGVKGPPTLSPDGNLVAFSWSGPPDKPDPGIYIKSVDGEELRRLTSGELPAWSPDGRDIAFLRDGENGGVFVISQLGGRERKVADSALYVGWTPDAQRLLIRVREPDASNRSSIFSVSLKTLEKRRLTRAPIPTGDWRFAVSPDGKVLAFIRSGLPGLSDIYTMPMEGGEPRRLTNWNGPMSSLAWTADGREIIYGVREPAGPRLWRISARVSSPGRGARLAESTGNAGWPVISRPGAGRPVRLAYLAVRQELGLHLIDLTHQESPGVLNPAKPFQRSSRQDRYGRVSPRGDRVAFASDREGSQEIWISGLDGSNLHRVTEMKTGTPFPAWSPDGESIAFLSTKGGVGIRCIFVVKASGGEPRQLTLESEVVGPPQWSGDGRWIYFMTDRSGSYQIWKMSSSGEHPVQITRQGGFEVQESPDGRDLYYTGSPPRDASGLAAPSKLMRVPVDGGEEVAVLPQVWTFHWSVTEKGIYYLFPGPPTKSLMLYRFRDGRTERVGDLSDQTAQFTDDAVVSRDGRWLFLTQIDRTDTDLMLIDKFR